VNFAELNLAAFRQCAEELGALAGDVAEAKHELDALQAAALHYWKGKAADAFRDHMQPQKDATQLTSDACDTASALIDRFASDVGVYKAQWERARHEAEAQGFAFVGDLIGDPKSPPVPNPGRQLTMLGLQKDVLQAIARGVAAEGELMQGLNSLNASADAARTLLKDKSGDGFLGAAKDAGEGVLREGTSVVLGLSTLGAYAVGGQIPPGSDKQLSVPETAAQAVDWEGISAAWKSGHPWKAIGIGIGVAAGVDQVLQPAVFVAQVAQLLGFVGLHAAVLVTPAAERLLADLERLGHLGHRLAFGEQPIGFAKLADDLLWGMSATLQRSSSLP